MFRFVFLGFMFFKVDLLSAYLFLHVYSNTFLAIYSGFYGIKSLKKNTRYMLDTAAFLAIYIYTL